MSNKPLGPTTEALRALDQAHHIHPFTDVGAYQKSGGRIVTRGEHIYFYDSEGSKVLDGMSGLWCCNLGYSQPKIVEAIHEQLQVLPFYNNFFQCSNDTAVKMAEAMAQVTPNHLNHVFFTNSGSEANDTNIKIVHRYYQILGKPEKKHFIARNNAYHGSTVAASSLSGMTFMHDQYTGIDYVHHIQQPYYFGEGGDLTPEEFGLQAARELEKKIEELGEDKVAAFIAEPIQGAGGVIIPPDSYWPEIQRICNEHDILLISDEVICGFGRTGSWFGCQTYGFKPDLMTFAKAVTNGFQALGGVMISDKIAEVLAQGKGDFAHGMTYSGHPVACAAGLATLDILRSQHTIENMAKDVGPYFEQRWKSLEAHPIVGEARAKNMVAALELVKHKGSKERLAPNAAATIVCRNQAIKEGLLVRAVGDAIVCAPPIVCSKQDVDIIIERMFRALDYTAKQYAL
ncbi:aminotransferase [Marinomonas spartinae]|uniref:aminotransferase n=1 Tax=Marinomonas spartinae TaxID=1792290 RepID=UPI0018F21486|nr:aminotransferase [Marinomonas spartinae]MBJ7556853.1 aminotransferase class III-fold pyridoxal phosphate-dependent enzyme [Marinomonas spartinae]